MTAAEAPAGPVHGTGQKRRVAVGSAVGTTIENYDFTAFGTAAAIYFGPAFFPGSDPVAATLLSFATLGVGFAVRPLGGLIGGHLGDRIGRRPVLLGALVLMGLATFGIGLLPTYAQVGVLAPVLLTVMRILQGLAFGAEWGGAIMLTYEHAPWRRRATYCALPQAGIPLGLLLANIVFFGVAGWDSDWAWRIPFLASAVLVVAGLVIRLTVDESPDFERIRDEGSIDRAPLVTVVREQWREIVRIIGMRVSQAGGFYIVVSYFTSYLASADLATRTTSLGAIVVAAALGVGATLLYGRLADAVGRRPLYLAGTGATVVLAFPMFWLLNSGAAFAVVAAYVLGLTLCHDLQSAPQGAWFSELFRTGTRTSGASIGYQFSAALAGFVPFFATAAAAGFGWPGVAGLYVLIALGGLVAAAATRETWGPAERASVDAVLARSTDDREGGRTRA
ncbi:MAG: MFS transporter [Pseudonocardia sediminis]